MFNTLSIALFTIFSSHLIFSLKSISFFYEYLIKQIGYSNLALFFIYFFIYICFNGFLIFLEQLKIQVKINYKKIFYKNLFISAILTIAIYQILDYFFHFWTKRNIVIFFNYLLYIFAWYSLIKAFKVWRNYGNFYILLLKGKISYSILIFNILLSFLTYELISLKEIRLSDEFGIFLISFSIVSWSSCFLSFIFYYNKTLTNKVLLFHQEVADRIQKGDKPKETSASYDLLSSLGIAGVILKRIGDFSHSYVDLPVVMSKICKIICYQVSLIVTYFFSKNYKKIFVSSLFILLLITFMLHASYKIDFRNFLQNNKDFYILYHQIINTFILPISIFKVLLQILKIIQFKKTTGISSFYFQIAAYFSFTTAFNLMIKGNYQDTTISQALYKGILYLIVIWLIRFINKHSKLKDQSKISY